MSDSESNCSSEEFSEEEEEYAKTAEIIVDPQVEKIVIEMLEGRGYELKQELQEDKVKNLVGSRDGARDLHVLFATDYAGGEEVKFNIKMVHVYIAHIDKKKLRHVIIIHQGKIASRVKELIQNYVVLKKTKIEIFAQSELKYNVTKHVLVPRHEAMSKEESKEFKDKYGKKFNSMLLSDPVARFYGYEKGDVVKVYRRGGVLSYRIVI